MNVITKKNLYPTEPLKTWNEAKYIRAKYYQDFLDAPKEGGLRVSGSTTMFFALLGGLGKDVHLLTGEPYSATSAFHMDFSTECMEAVEKAGIAGDLCGYMRNYWGGVLLDKYILPDGTVVSPWPKPDFFFSSHYCCTHAKWYQWCREMEGNLPMYVIDVPWHPYDHEPTKERVEYMVQQSLEGIEWMEKVTGRKYNDELLKQAVDNELMSSYLWAQIMLLNQAIPAPLDEKTMFSLYVFNTICPQLDETVQFYERLLDEVRDRVQRGIAACPNERFRYVSDSQPPWSYLHVFRHLERTYGAVSIGSLYSLTITINLDFDEEGNLIPLKTPQMLGLRMDTREQIVRAYLANKMKHCIMCRLYDSEITSRLIKSIVEKWKAQAVVMHLNRGCEGTAIGQMENRLDLMSAGIPILTYEGNMGDHREFDLARTVNRIDTFFESLGIERFDH